MDTQNDGLERLSSYRCCDGLEKVVPFPNLRRDESSQSKHPQCHDSRLVLPFW